jgi:hypothetical protein
VATWNLGTLEPIAAVTLENNLRADEWSNEALPIKPSTLRLVMKLLIISLRKDSNAFTQAIVS